MNTYLRKGVLIIDFNFEIIFIHHLIQLLGRFPRIYSIS